MNTKLKIHSFKIDPSIILFTFLSFNISNKNWRKKSNEGLWHASLVKNSGLRKISNFRFVKNTKTKKLQTYPNVQYLSKGQKREWVKSFSNYKKIKVYPDIKEIIFPEVEIFVEGERYCGFELYRIFIKKFFWKTWEVF